MRFDYKGSFSEFEKSATEMEKTILPQAMKGALNRATTKVLKATVDVVSKSEGVQPKVIKKLYKRLSASKFRLRSGAVMFNSVSASFIARHTRLSAQGSTITVGKGKFVKKLAPAYINRSRFGNKPQIFQRQSKKRYPISVPVYNLQEPFSREFSKAEKAIGRPFFKKEFGKQIKTQTEKKINARR